MVFQTSVTSVIVSAFGRSLRSRTDRPIENAFQTDDVLNPSHSGGPVVDAHGLLVGISTAVIGGDQDICFAVPVRTVRCPYLGLTGEIRPVASPQDGRPRTECANAAASEA
jgi:S1-C subfamily serine protease